MASAQYTNNFQTNVVSGVVSNWAGNYLVGSNTFADVLLIQNGGVLSSGPGQLGCMASSNNNVQVVNGGVWQSDALSIGHQASGNSLVVGGGSVLATRLTVGFDSATCGNLIELDNGSVFVTNATADAVLEVRSGQFILNGGVLLVDKLVMTNACGLFVNNGGTLVVGSLVLDPNLSALGDGIPNGWKQQYGLDPLDPTVGGKDLAGTGFTVLQNYQAGTDPTSPSSAMRILGLTMQGSDVLITWQAGGDRTNVLQAADNTSGVYFNISPNIVTPDAGGVVTNYLERGAATNKTSRVYRAVAMNSSVTGTTAPPLTITSPVDETYITNLTVAVAGTIANTSGVIGVEIQGIAVSSTNGYSNWSAVVTGLAPGTNTVMVLAGDDAAPSNIATNYVHVICAVGDFDDQGDGLPDGWQLQYFGCITCPQAGPEANPSGNGIDNLQAYLEGLDPTDSNTVQRITSTVPEGDDIDVYFTSVSGVYYSLERFDPTSGVWTDVVNNIPGNGGIQWVKDIGAVTDAVQSAQFTSDGSDSLPSYQVVVQSGGPSTDDTDGDGIPDWWRELYFGHPTGLAADSSRATDDADGDGLNNLEEYLLGTNPLNPDSEGNGISDGPLVPTGSGLSPGPNPDLMVFNGTVCYPYSGVGAVTVGMQDAAGGPSLCPFLRVSLSPTMSTSTVFSTTDGPVTYALTESYGKPTDNIYVQYADANTNALGGVIHGTVPFFLETGSARGTATAGIETNLAAAALNTNSNWWATNVSIYASMNPATTNYVRNSSCWASGFDLTCIAVYNSYEGGSQMAGTLISPRHVLFAHHYYPPNGTVLWFVANDNTVVSRVLSNSVQINLTDLQIGVLDSDVPTNLITFAQVLPSDYTNYFPNSLNPISTNTIPALCLNQNESALESDISSVTAGISLAAPTDPTRSLFYQAKVSGDSGQPAFMILNGQLVLLTVYTYGGTGSGWFITPCLSQINSAMATLGGGYSLTTVDLSPFASCGGNTGQ